MSDLAEVTTSVKFNTTDEEGVVLAEITEVDFDRGQLRLTYEMSNGNEVSERFSVPTDWSRERRYVRFVELDNTGWDATTFEEHRIVGEKIKVHRTDRNGWRAYLPEDPPTKRERVRRTLSFENHKDLIKRLFTFVSGVSFLLVILKTIQLLLVGLAGTLL